MTTETALAQRPAMSLPAPLPEHPTTRSLESPSIIEVEGPSDGLTLDAAINQMLATNLDILALEYEIPQADADILNEGSAERLEIVLEKAEVNLQEARDALSDAQKALAVLLSSPPEQTPALQPRGSLRNRAAAPPPVDPGPRFERWRQRHFCLTVGDEEKPVGELQDGMLLRRQIKC